MSNRGGGVPERVISLAPKVDVRSEAGDPLDRAGKAIVALLHRAASDAEAKNQQALAMTHQLSAQPRAAEDRIRELEAHVRHYQERTDRAEKWLHRMSSEIEQRFFGGDTAFPSQPPSPQALLRSQRQ
jgi:hypothetical protein